jgi:excisionase family DNA binding protein
MSTLDVPPRQQSDDDPVWGFTVPQVAERLNVHRATVYKWMDEGLLDFIKIGANRRIPKESVPALLRDEPQPLQSRARRERARERAADNVE